MKVVICYIVKHISMATSWYISGFIDPWCGIGDNIPQSPGTYHSVLMLTFFFCFMIMMTLMAILS